MEDEARLTPSSDFGDLLRRHRLAAGLSQEALAERARMSSEAISALERGHRRTPRRETLVLLAGALALDDARRREFEAAARSGTRYRRGASVTVGPWADARTAILPLALTRFVGRELELNEITALLQAHRLVTLTGAGGVGKTQTALRAAVALSDTSDATVRFVSLAPMDDPALVVTAIANALGVQEVPNHPLLDTLTTFLKNKTILLILDNCEHVIEAAATIADSLLHACPSLRILATSREPFRAGGEHTYRLPSLDETDASALFADRARAGDAGFTLTDENRPVVSQICRSLGGIPLAIELAATQVPLFQPRALAKALDSRFQIHFKGARTAPLRQQTMRAAIDWSYELLTVPEQRLFERLSVFVGGCTIDTARAVCDGGEVSADDVLPLVLSLVSKSLLMADVEGREPRYQMLEPFREYARLKLDVRAEHDLTARRHALACLELAGRLDRAYDCEPDEVWLGLYYDEADNWRAAMHWALIERGDVAIGQQLVGALRVAWEFFVPLEGRRWLAHAQHFLGDQAPPTIRAGLKLAEATIAWQCREYNVVMECAKMAAEQYREIGDLVGLTRARSLLGYALMVLQRPTEAKAVHKEALAGARSLGNCRLVAYSLRFFAYASGLGGDLATARRYIAEALQNYDAFECTHSRVAAMHDLSYLEFHAGNVSLALATEQDVLTAWQQLDYGPRHTMLIFSNLTVYTIALDRYEEAEQYARQCLSLSQEQQMDVLVAWALQHLAAVAVLRPRASAQEHSVRLRAAQVMGFVDARLAALQSTQTNVERPEHDRLLEVLNAELSDAELRRLMTAGAAMTEEAAAQMALAL